MKINLKVLACFIDQWRWYVGPIGNGREAGVVEPAYLRIAVVVRIGLVKRVEATMK